MSPVPYVSVLTTSYSGATLLALIAGRHPDIATVAELNGPPPVDVPDSYSCSCGVPLRKCAFAQWHTARAGIAVRNVNGRRSVQLGH